MYTIDEHEAFQAMAVFLQRYDVDDLFTVLLDIGLSSDGTTHDPASWPEWIEAIRDVRAGMVPGAPLEAAPQAVKTLGVGLERAGFEQLTEGHDDRAVGAGCVEWSRKGISVRALRDRLDWSIWIGADYQLYWYSVSVWEEFLLRGRLPSSSSTLTLIEQCEHAAALASVLPEVDDPLALRLSIQALGQIANGYAVPRSDSVWKR